VLFTGVTRSGLCSPGPTALPSSLRTPPAFAMLLDPDGPSRQVIYGARAWPRRLLLPGQPSVMTFEALSHGFSRRCLRFVPSSRTTTQNSLPVADQPFRVGFSMPTEFVWRVSHLHALPSPRALLGAKQFSFCCSAGVPANACQAKPTVGWSSLPAGVRGRFSRGSSIPLFPRRRESGITAGSRPQSLAPWA